VAAVADGILFIWGKLGKGFVEWGIKEYRVIPESALSFFLAGDEPVGVFLDFCDNFFSVGQNHAGNESSIPIFFWDSVQEPEYFLKIVLIGCVWSGKPGGIYSWGALEIIYLQT